MRYVTIPDPVALIEPSTGKPYQKLDPDGPTQAQMRAGAEPILIDEDPVSFYTWFLRCVLGDEKFNKGIEGWQSTAKLKELFESAEAGAVVPVEDEDWKLAADVAKKPSNPVYPTGIIGFQHLPLIEALTGTEGREIPSKKPKAESKTKVKRKLAKKKGLSKKPVDDVEQDLASN